MKKTIKTGFALIVLLGSMNGFSQENPTAPTPLQIARIQLFEGTKNYNPTAALTTFKRFANQGNPEAMNGLGLIYSQGLGVTANEVVAVEWFEKAAQKKYAKAYFNLASLYKKGVAGSTNLTKALSYYQKAAQLGLDEGWYEWGMMHKNGLGTPQDDQKAVTIFKEGASKGSYNAIYALGYMTYKGLGTKQDYTAALALFQKAAQHNSAGMFMLGVCYRNGYGVEKDEQKGIYWLNKSAAMGYEFAKKELKEPQPENAAPNQTKTLSTPISQTNDAPIEAPLKLQRVAQKRISGDMSGLYTGTLLRYDFSGQNVISTTPIEVSFDQNGTALSGIWKEKAGDSIAFRATVNEKNIVFANSTIERVEHFTHNELRKYSFKEAQLQLVENQDDLYIVGNLQLYDLQQHEPEKPMYLILTRKNDPLLLEDAQQIVSQLLVYPNPVTTGQFTLYFDLAQQTPITVKIYDLIGVQQYEQELTTTGTGQQEQVLKFAAPAGNYVLNLYYGSHVLRTILIKK